MDMSRSPRVGVVEPGIGSWTNGQKAIEPVLIGQAAAHAQEIGIECAGPLIAFVQVASSGIGLPDLQQSVGYWIAVVVEYAASYNDALADGLATGSCVARKVGVLRGNSTDSWSRAGQFREGQRNLDEWHRGSPAPGGLIGFVQVGREDLPVSPYDLAYGSVIHIPSEFAFAGSTCCEAGAG